LPGIAAQRAGFRVLLQMRKVSRFPEVSDLEIGIQQRAPHGVYALHDLSSELLYGLAFRGVVAVVLRMEALGALYSFRLAVDYLGGVISNVKYAVLLKDVAR
jgi:hypothetical protein